MPVNEVKKQFIRIDKKSLVELGISNIYTMPMSKDIARTIKDDEFEQKANHIKMIIDKNIIVFKKLSGDGFLERKRSKKSINCYIHVSTNEDQNNSIAVELKIITKDELDKRDDKSHARVARSWWLDDVLDVYSKKANIWRRILRSRMLPPRQLRRENLIRSPMSFKEYPDIATMEREWLF